MTTHDIVSRESWLGALAKLLEQEKAFTRQRDQLAAARRALPWVRVENDYRFDTGKGAIGLADLFGECSQLAVYHFMFDDDWESGCKSCSFWADNYNGITEHLRARDVSFVAVSKAPVAKLHAFRARMGWRFPWVQSPDNVFGKDFGVSFSDASLAAGMVQYNYAPIATGMRELPGLSAFLKDTDGSIYHTYSCYARGLDMLNSAYQHLDLMPRGRGEDGLDFSMAWVRLRDEY